MMTPFPVKSLTKGFPYALCHLMMGHGNYCSTLQQGHLTSERFNTVPFILKWLVYIVLARAERPCQRWFY